MIIMAADKQGFEIVRFLSQKKENIQILVLDEKNRKSMNQAIINEVNQNSCTIMYYEELKKEENLAKIRKLNIDFGILAWWPYIITREMIRLTKRGFVNTHPAFLPYNRGKAPYTWSIIEHTPFGASIHWINEKIDSGVIIDREEIEVTWEDDSDTLYKKSCDLTVELLKKNYDAIRNGKEKSVRKIEDGEGTFHYAKEIEGICEIDLDKSYPARDLLDLLRSRMISGQGTAYFRDQGAKYYVGISIKKST